MNQQVPVVLPNPLDPKYQENPHAVLDPLRASNPIYHDTAGKRIVFTRAKDIGEVLNDRANLSDPRKTLPGSYQRKAFRVDDNFKPSLLRMDDPDHKRVRSAVTKVFNQPSIDARKPRIREIAEGFVNSLEGRSTFDFIEEFARPFPVAVIAEILGVGEGSLADFKTWSKAQLHAFDPQPSPQQLADLAWGSKGLQDYFKKIVDERRVERGSDLVSALISAEEKGELTEWEILSTCELLLLAGNVTTTDLLGNGMCALLQHPEQLQKLRGNTSLMSGAIEEMLRYDSPVTGATRVSTEGTRVDGCPFHAGEGLSLALDAANHDPALHENPHSFDIERTNKRNYSFGGGAHFCLGAPLARAEAEIAFTLLLERFPKLALNQDRLPVRKVIPAFSGWASLWLTA